MHLYVHSTYTSVQLHNHTSLSIRPNRLCDAGESPSQLRAGYASLLLVISLHVHTLYIRCHHCSSLYVHCTYLSVHVTDMFILFNVCTWFILVHPGSPVSAENISLMCAICTCLYSAVPALNNAMVQESAIWYRQGSYRYVPPKNGYVRWVAFLCYFPFYCTDIT